MSIALHPPLSEELLSEVYGVLMVLGIVMNENEALEALKKAGYDQEVSQFILNTALEVQEITRHHNDKLNEIESQVQITPEQMDLLAKAYLEAQGIPDELIEVVVLFHSFQTSLDLSEVVITQGEKQALSTREIITNISKLGHLDKASAETMYITAMTRMGKPYELPSRGARFFKSLGLILLLVGLVVYVFVEGHTTASIFAFPGLVSLIYGIYKASL